MSAAIIIGRTNTRKPILIGREKIYWIRQTRQVGHSQGNGPHPGHQFGTLQPCALANPEGKKLKINTNSIIKNRIFLFGENNFDILSPLTLKYYSTNFKKKTSTTFQKFQFCNPKLIKLSL